MTPFLRLTSAALLLWAVSPEALAQNRNAIVVTSTEDGFALSSPSDDPIGDAPSALLVHIGDNAWSMRALSSGDVPSEIVMRPPATTVRALTTERRAVLDRHLATAEQRVAQAESVLSDYNALFDDDRRVFRAKPEAAVRFSVSGVIQGDASDVLVRLSESQPLSSLESSSANDGATRVGLEFRFTSVDEWAEWKASAETEALLAPLGSVQTDLRMQRR